jgi:flagellar motor switch protein FliM
MTSATPPTPPLEAAAPPAPQVLLLTPKGTRERRAATAIRSHDFRQTGFLATSELRRIRLRHEQFARSLASRLSISLRLEFGLQLSKVEIVAYQKFTDPLPAPSSITLFRTEPLKGLGLLVMPARLCLGLVERLLGGPGQMPDGARELTEIEIALTDQITHLFLAEWCFQWPEMAELCPTLLGHESNSRFLQTSSPECAMLVLTLDAALGDQTEVVQLAFPYGMVEPLIRQLGPTMPQSEHAPARAASVRWNSEYDDLKVNTSAQWQALKISAAKITRLRPGDVLMLAPGSNTQVQVRLSQVTKFLGQPGVSGNKWAVQLTDRIDD